MLAKIIISVLLLKTKLVFTRPKQNNYLIYGKAGSFLKIYLDKKKTTVLYNNLEEINIFILFHSFFNFKKENISTRYILTYIKYVKPKNIVSNIDTNLAIYKLHKFFSNIKIIVIQNSRRIFINDFNINIKEKLIDVKKMNLKCDYFFYLSPRYLKEYKKFLSAKYILSGSIKSNIYKVMPSKEESIILISQFNTDRVKNKDQEYLLAEKIVLKNLIKFCKSKNKLLQIFLRFGNKKEKNYFTSLLNNDDLEIINFIWKNKISEKFQFLDNSKLIVCLDSTLGYEMIARKKKVLLLSFRDKFLKKEVFRFSHFGFSDEDIPKEGPFWLNRYNNESEIIFKINSIYETPLNKLILEYDINKEGLFYSDYGNKQLQKILN